MGEQCDGAVTAGDRNLDETRCRRRERHLPDPACERDEQAGHLARGLERRQLSGCGDACAARVHLEAVDEDTFGFVPQACRPHEANRQVAGGGIERDEVQRGGAGAPRVERTLEAQRKAGAPRNRRRRLHVPQHAGQIEASSVDVDERHIWGVELNAPGRCHVEVRGPCIDVRGLPVELHGRFDAPQHHLLPGRAGQRDLCRSARLLRRAGAGEAEVQPSGQRLVGVRDQLPVRAIDRCGVLIGVQVVGATSSD